MTAHNVELFCKIWSAAAGYANPFGAVKPVVVDFKKSLIQHMLTLAQEGGWVYGHKAAVLYIDTPLGQISWHTNGTSYTSKTYAREWSGQRNSDSIICQLLAAAW